MWVLKLKGETMKFVCPKPQPWLAIYDSLKAAWASAGSNGTPPPFPLILNGWMFSSDFDKHVRWLDTIKWAEDHSLSYLIPAIKADDKYEVSELSDRIQ